MRHGVLWVGLLALIGVAACRPTAPASPTPTPLPPTPTATATAAPEPSPAPPSPVSPSLTPVPVMPTPVPFRLFSPAFGYGEPIPVRYTCQGQDLIPPLRWENPPAGTQSFVLLMEDPDAPRGTWDHWVVYDIPPQVTGVEEGQAPPGKVGRNSWGDEGYGGPCPPPGPAHRYFFRLYALDVPELGLEPGATKAQVLEAMEGRVLGQAEYMGTYARQGQE